MYALRTPISIDPSTILRKDIYCLEEKLVLLKEEHFRLYRTTLPGNELIRRMKEMCEEQEEQLVELLKMEEIME